MTEKAKSPAAERSPAGSYLELIHGRIRAIRHDLPLLIEMGEKMARPMLDGGRFFTPHVAAFWPSEFGSRAGGFMGLK